MNPNLEVALSIRMPNGGKVLRVALQLSEHLFEKSLAPLPPDRELPLAVQSRIRAGEQQRMRRLIARDMAEQITAKMLELIEKEDPRHGYSPEEWKHIQGP